MTNLDPKHLDALTLRLAKLAKDMDQHATDDWDEHEDVMAAADAITALRAENDRLSNLWQIEHDHATALRAQIDRERAATIEAAARRIEPGPNADDLPKAVLTVAQCCIRALHTDATRAALNAIRREGYEAGVREERAKSADLANAARDLADCCQLGEDADWEEGEDPLSALRAVLADITPPKTDRSEITP